MEAYDLSLSQDLQASKLKLPNRQRIEQNFVSELDSKLALVQDQGQALEDRIYDQIQEAVKQGQELAEEQASLFLADELEAKRQLEQSAWLESFVEEHCKNLPPPEFLDAWHCNAKIRKELADLGTLSQQRTSAALRVEGGFRLHTVSVAPSAQGIMIARRRDG